MTVADIVGGVSARIVEGRGWRGKGRDRRLVLEISSAHPEGLADLAAALNGSLVVFRTDEDGCVIAAIRGGRTELPPEPAPPPVFPVDDPRAHPNETALLAYMGSGRTVGGHMANVRACERNAREPLTAAHFPPGILRDAYAQMQRAQGSDLDQNQLALAIVHRAETREELAVGEWLRQLRHTSGWSHLEANAYVREMLARGPWPDNEPPKEAA